MQTLIIPLQKAYVLPKTMGTSYDSRHSYIPESPTSFLRKLCKDKNYKFHEDTVTVEITGDAEHIKSARQCVMASYYLPYTESVTLYDSLIPLGDELRQALDRLSRFTETVLVVITTGNETVVKVNGHRDSVLYAKYKLRVLLEIFSGRSVQYFSIPLSQHALVSGSKKCHLRNIFSQTGVNVYSPPSMLELCGPQPASRPLNEMYLVGDPHQLSVAQQMLEELCSRTDIMISEISIPQHTRDILVLDMADKLSLLCLRNAAFIQFAPLGSDISIVKIQASSRLNIDATITELYQLCSQVASFQCMSRVSMPQETVKFLGLVELAKAHKVFILSGSENELTLYGGFAATQKAAWKFCSSQEHRELTLEFQLDLVNSLKDFIEGKKMGKLRRIMANSDSKLWLSPIDPYIFRLHISAESLPRMRAALQLLEQELPSELTLSIPRPFHKAIIGTAGAEIQSLMKKYNVFIKFEAHMDKVTDSITPCTLDNVLIRCPAKNSENLEPAARELMKEVESKTKGLSSLYVRVSRNHRRALSTKRANIVAEMDEKFNVIVKFPTHDTSGDSLVQILGSQDAVAEAARFLQSELPTDYEFRLASNQRFSTAVDASSSFTAQVCIPLRLAFDAHVQAFERVKVENDSFTYSQVVVSLYEDSQSAIDVISEVVTTYLRSHGLDIIDKGRISNRSVIGTSSPSKNMENPGKVFNRLPTANPETPVRPLGLRAARGFSVLGSSGPWNSGT